MKVLLLMNYIPEKTIGYLIEDPTHEELNLLKKSAGQCINTDNWNDEISQLFESIEDNEEKWEKREIHTTQQIHTTQPIYNIDMVVMCGIIL